MKTNWPARITLTAALWVLLYGFIAFTRLEWWIEFDAWYNHERGFFAFIALWLAVMGLVCPLFDRPE